MLDEKYVILVIDGVTISGTVVSEADFDPEILAEWRALGKEDPVVLLQNVYIPGARQQDDMVGNTSARWVVVERRRISAMAITGENLGKKTLAALRATKALQAEQEQLDQLTLQHPDQQT